MRRLHPFAQFSIAAVLCYAVFVAVSAGLDGSFGPKGIDLQQNRVSTVEIDGRTYLQYRSGAHWHLTGPIDGCRCGGSDAK